MVDPVERFQFLSYLYIFHLFLCWCNSDCCCLRSYIECGEGSWIRFFKFRREPLAHTGKIHNKTKNSDGSKNPKKFVKQTKRWRTTEVAQNGLIFSEFDRNKVGNIVLKYIPCENSLSEDIQIVKPGYRIGISNYEMNLEEPTLIYVHTCFGSPEKSKSKSLHKGF